LFGCLLKLLFCEGGGQKWEFSNHTVNDLCQSINRNINVFYFNLSGWLSSALVAHRTLAQSGSVIKRGAISQSLMCGDQRQLQRAKAMVVLS